MNKEKLLKEIMDWYNYDYKIENGKVVVDNGVTDQPYGLNFVGVRVECGHFEYDSIDEVLKDWLSTLEESNDDYFKNEGQKYGTWSKEEIDFIKGL